MRTWVMIGCVAALAACSPLAANAPAELTGQALVERGEYLVTAIGGCNDCHTPMTPQGPDITKSLQGAPLGFELVPALRGSIPWVSVAPQIAGGPAGYSDETFEHFLQTGERPNGTHATPPMPQFRFNADDAHAVAAYIKSLPRAEATTTTAP